MAAANRPSMPLLVATIAVIGVTVALPFSPAAGALGFVGVPAAFLGVIAVIVLAYVVGAERANQWLYRRVSL